MLGWCYESQLGGGRGGGAEQLAHSHSERICVESSVGLDGLDLEASASTSLSQRMSSNKHLSSHAAVDSGQDTLLISLPHVIRPADVSYAVSLLSVHLPHPSTPPYSLLLARLPAHSLPLTLPCGLATLEDCEREVLKEGRSRRACRTPQERAISRTEAHHHETGKRRYTRFRKQRVA